MSRDLRRLARIKRRRADNNDLWMEILRIALEVAPKRTKKVLRRIKRNDRKIHVQLRKLAR